MNKEIKEKEDKKERKRGQMIVLGRERALGVGLCEVYSPRPLLHGLELAASVCVC